MPGSQRVDLRVEASFSQVGTLQAQLPSHPGELRHPFLLQCSRNYNVGEHHRVVVCLAHIW